MEQASIRFHGARGTMPTARAETARYGGDTACVEVRMGGETIFLDAGSGLPAAYALSGDAPAWAGRPSATLLLSHPHIDHQLGLPLVLSSWRPEAGKLHVYAKNRGGLSAAGQLAALVAPPLWPASLGVFAAALRVQDLPDGPFTIGPVQVDTMEGDHPGGCTVYRLACGGKSLVYATDFEHGLPQTPALARFAAGCTLLVYDAHYTNEEYPAHRGWGHSTWQAGEAMARRCGAQNTRLFHHAPTRTDDQLDELAARLTLPGCRFARQGEEILL